MFIWYCPLSCCRSVPTPSPFQPSSWREFFNRSLSSSQKWPIDNGEREEWMNNVFAEGEVPGLFWTFTMRWLQRKKVLCVLKTTEPMVCIFSPLEFILPLFWTKYCDIGPNSLTFLDCSGVCCNDPQPHSSPYWRSCAKWRSVTWFFIKHSSWTSDRCHFQTSEFLLLSSESNWAI